MRPLIQRIARELFVFFSGFEDDHGVAVVENKDFSTRKAETGADRPVLKL